VTIPKASSGLGLAQKTIQTTVALIDSIASLPRVDAGGVISE